jgi:hypothetical protein
MLLHTMQYQVVKIALSIVNKIEKRLMASIEPSTDKIISGIAADLVKSKQQVILENAILRQHA